MPFEVLETVSSTKRRVAASISYMRPNRKKKGQRFEPDGEDPKRLPALIVTLTTATFISKAARFQVLIGTGADADKLRIQACPDDRGVAPVEFTSHCIFRFGHVPAMGEDAFDKIDCALTRVSDDVYDVTVKSGILKDAAVAVLRGKTKPRVAA